MRMRKGQGRDPESEFTRARIQGPAGKQNSSWGTVGAHSQHSPGAR